MAPPCRAGDPVSVHTAPGTLPPFPTPISRLISWVTYLPGGLGWVFLTVDMTSSLRLQCQLWTAARWLQRGPSFPGSSRQGPKQPQGTRRMLTAALSGNPHLNPTCQPLLLQASEPWRGLGGINPWIPASFQHPGLVVVVGGAYSIKEEICFEMKTLLFLICLALGSPAFLVCMNSAPISRLPLSIFSRLTGLERAPSPHPPPGLSQDKLLTSVKAFLINRGIRHGVSSGVQRLLIKGGGGPGHTSLLVHLSGQFSTFPPECPWQRRTQQPTISSHAPTPQGGEQGGNASKGTVGSQEQRSRKRSKFRSLARHRSSRQEASSAFHFWPAAGMSISQAIPQGRNTRRE